MLHWAIANRFSNLFNIGNTAVARRIELNNIDTSTRSNPAACFALIAGFGDVRIG
jgi:hypothetical protein